MSLFYADAFVQLFHGDCYEILPTVSADVVVTDPPYGLLADSGKVHMGGGVVNEADWGEWDRVASWDWLALCQGIVAAVVFHDHKDATRAWEGLAAVGVPPRQFLYWDKGDSGLNPRRNFVNCVEQAIYGRRGTSPWNGGAITPNILRVNRAPTPDHPTQKPIALMSRILRVVTDVGTMVLDPFAGSGSTLVAAKVLGRKSIGIEIDEKYCEIAARRISMTNFQEVLPWEDEPIQQSWLGTDETVDG